MRSFLALFCVIAFVSIANAQVQMDSPIPVTPSAPDLEMDAPAIRLPDPEDDYRPDAPQKTKPMPRNSLCIPGEECPDGANCRACQEIAHIQALQAAKYRAQRANRVRLVAGGCAGSACAVGAVGAGAMACGAGSGGFRGRSGWRPGQRIGRAIRNRPRILGRLFGRC